MSFHHTSDILCPLCESKILTAHPYMRGWFRGVKQKYVNVHVSWAYRDEQDQEAAFIAGKTRAHFPDSPHNRVNPEGRWPESMALDLFLISEDGVASFPRKFYEMLAKQIADDKLPIVWGGLFKTIEDGDHFQYVPVPPQA